MTQETSELPSGAAAAAFVASGIGCLMAGVMTILSEASPTLKRALNWYTPSGPLVGKAMTSIAIWLVSWAGLHIAWRKKSVSLYSAIIVSLILISIGFAATFPPFLQLAEH